MPSIGVLGPLEAQFPTRTVQEEEEEEAEKEAYKCLEPALALLSPSYRLLRDAGEESKLLIIGCTSLSCALLLGWVKDDQIVGSVLLPEVTISGNALRPSLDDKTAFIYQLQPGVLVVPCLYHVKESRAVAWADAVMKEIRPQNVIVCGALQVHEYRDTGDISDDDFFFGIQTSTLCTNSVLNFPPPLPPGNAIGGLSAAILMHCELHKQQARLIIQVEQKEGCLSHGAMEKLGHILKSSAETLGILTLNRLNAQLAAPKIHAHSGVRHSGNVYT